MAAITPSLPNGDKGISDVEIGVCGLDGRVRRIAGLLTQPQEATEAKTFIAVLNPENQTVYIKIEDLAKLLGIAKEELKEKTPEEVTKLIESHNTLIFTTMDILYKTALKKSNFPTIIRFMAVQLKGREEQSTAIPQLRAAARKAETLRAMLYAATDITDQEGYLGKEKEEPSILLVDKQIYLGQAALGRGYTSKVSQLHVLGSPERVVKAVARGDKKVQDLERHLQMAETLHDLGIPCITPVHRFLFDLHTRKGESKLMALVDQLDGDARRIVDLNINSVNVGNVLMLCAYALAGMHEHHYVHSDVKAANILLRGDPSRPPGMDEEAKLLALECVLHDFGGTGQIGEPISIRTALYAAPEVLSKRETTLTPAQDAFSFGVTIFELASTLRTLRDPNVFFGQAKEDKEFRNRIRKVKRLIASENNLEVFEKVFRIQLLDIAQRLLRVDPADRMTMGETRDLLTEALRLHIIDLFKDDKEAIFEQKLQQIIAAISLPS